MRLLIDTHALLWWLDGNRKLSVAARRAIEDSEGTVFVSSASGWEIATRYRIGKLPLGERLHGRLSEAIAEQGFESLAISFELARIAGNLPGQHGDPFDRILAAQAVCENLVLVTRDERIREFGSRTLW